MRMSNELTKSPALDALGKVREAEEQAKAIVREAREIISVQVAREAAEQAEAIKKKALDEAKKEAESRKQAILERAHEQAGAIRAETEAELEELRQRARAAFGKAVDQVSLKMKEILEKGLV